MTYLDRLADVFSQLSPEIWAGLRNGALLALSVPTTVLVYRAWIVSRRIRLLKKTESDEGLDKEEYDVIIVGGGPAGCVLAARLSEDPFTRVLLLEAGRPGYGLPYTEKPVAMLQYLVNLEDDYKVWTEAQENAAGRRCFWPRASLLGGCTNVNAMMFHEGAPSDYDEWAALQKNTPGASGWAYRNLVHYFHKFENFIPSKKFPGVDAKLRGIGGPVDTGYFGYFSKLSALFIKACEAAGIAYKADINTYKGTLGTTKIMTYIDAQGRRVTAESAYITANVLARPNLRILTKAPVARIITGTEDGIVRARGVEYMSAEGLRTVLAAHEVVVCAGSIHTPHLLMLSGIGPSAELSAHDIDVVVDLPGVGSNLKDHLVIDLAYMDKTKTSLSFLGASTLTQRLQVLQAALQYALTRTGPLTTNLVDSVAFLRTDDPHIFSPSMFSKSALPEDTTSGQNAPDLELFFSPLAYSDHASSPSPNTPYYNFMMHAVLLRPKSTGTIRLQSNKFSDLPIVDPQYLADANDVKTLILAVRLLDKISRTEPIASVIDPVGDSHPELHHNLYRRSDKEIEEILRKRVETLYHPTSTARMAPLEDGGVVDPYLRVYGIKNLRVCDASIFPSIVSGHTTAPVYAVAEKAADLIRADLRR